MLKDFNIWGCFWLDMLKNFNIWACFEPVKLPLKTCSYGNF